MLTFTKYQQSAFSLNIDDQIIAVDFGSFTSLLALEQTKNPVVSLVTHIHKDHFNQDNLLFLGAPVITVSEVAKAITEPGLKITTIAEGQTLPLANTSFEVRATASNHGTNISAPVENVGFLLSGYGKNTYYLGDMAISTPPPAGAFDLTLIPIGNRGYVFNAEEAYSHLQSIEHPGIVVPIHYFNGGQEQVEIFKELIGDRYDLRILQDGDSLTL